MDAFRISSSKKNFQTLVSKWLIYNLIGYIYQYLFEKERSAKAVRLMFRGSSQSSIRTSLGCDGFLARCIYAPIVFHSIVNARLFFLYALREYIREDRKKLS